VDEPVSFGGAATASGVKRAAVRGTAANVIGTALSLAVAFVTTPFFVHELGASAYGVYALVLVFTTTGYFAYLDFGVPAAVVQFAGTAAARNQWAGVSRAVASGAAILAVIGVLVGVVLAGVSGLLTGDVFNLPTQYHGAFRFGLFLAALAVAVQLPALAVSSALQVVRRWDVIAIARTAASLIGIVTAAIAVALNGGLSWLIGPVVIVPALVAVGVSIYAHRLVPSLSLSPRQLNRIEVRRLARFGAAVFAAQAGIAVVATFDQVLIAAVLNAHAIAVYAIAATLYYPVFGLMPLLNTVVFPSTVAFLANDNVARVRLLLMRGTRIAASIVLCVAATVVVWGWPFIRAWVGPEFHESSVLLVIWLLHLPVTAIASVGATMFAPLGRIRAAAYVSLLSAVINITISVALIGPYGLPGVIVGTVAAYLVTGPIAISLFLRPLQLNWWDFLRQVLPAPLAVLGVTLAFGWVVRLLVDPHRLVFVMGAGAATLGVGAAVVWVLLPSADRADLVAGFRRG
jgi:O-antigen/teichoic acid export membrane protein